MLHTFHNALIYSLFEPLTVHSEEITAYAQGEQGFTLLLTLAVVAAIFWRPAWRAAETAADDELRAWRVAHAAISARERRPSLLQMRSAWVSAVRSVMTNVSAI